MKLAIALTLTISVLMSAELIYFSDDFNDGNADGWTELATGAQYEVNGDLRYQITAGAGVGDASTYNADGPDGMSVSDYSICAEFCVHSPTHGASFFARYDKSSETGYSIYFRVHADQIRIYRHDPSFTELVQVDFPFEYDQLYWARFNCNGDSLMGKVWQGELADEPSSWLIAASDSTYTYSGYFMLSAINLTAQNGIDGEFDNVVVSEPVPQIVQATTWADIKITL